MAKSISQFEESLFQENDGNKFSKTVNKLIKEYGVSDREKVLDILTAYSKNGSMHHWRNFLLTDIIKLVREHEAKYTVFFDWCITQPELTYWGIDGLLKTKGQNAYPALITLAQKEDAPLPVRAKAIKSMALHSQQSFDRDLPKDPGYWKMEDLRISELLNWQKEGYKTGNGYAIPRVHPSLQHPKTALEIAVSMLDKKLETERNKEQDLSNPSNWLVVADDARIKEIEKKWLLPEHYFTFLKNYSPSRVYIDNPKFFQGLWLYGADELIKAQEGYSFNAVTGKDIEDWPSNYLVIADAGSDPYCIDLGNIKDDDAPIYTSMHGTGKWEFEKYADSFIGFLYDITED